jgi:uncharacterized membrane protein
MHHNLLMLNDLYFAFGATIYVGTMWALRFFFYPSWRSMTPATVFDHFVVPTRAATRFFTVVVPLMFVAAVVAIVEEWGHAQLWQAAVCLAGVGVSSFVGQVFIIPINKRVAAGVAADAAQRLDQAGLDKLLRRWMALNDVRWVTTTITWVAIMWLLVAKGDLSRAFGR